MKPLEQTGVLPVINQYLTFRLAGEQYAIRVTSIREVLELPQLTRVPRMPDFMSGVINLRGSVVPVVDLKTKFGIPVREGEASSNIIVTEVEDYGSDEDDDAEQLTIGIFADSVQEVLTLEEGDIEPTPRIGIPVNTAFLLGMGKKDDEFILILDIDKVLNTKELTELCGDSEGLFEDADSDDASAAAGETEDSDDTERTDN